MNYHSLKSKLAFLCFVPCVFCAVAPSSAYGADYELFMGSEVVRNITNGDNIVTYVSMGSNRKYACVARNEGDALNVNQGVQFDVAGLNASAGIQNVRTYTSNFSETSSQYVTFEASGAQMQVSLPLDVGGGGTAQGYIACCLAEASVPYNTIFPQFAFLEFVDRRVDFPAGFSANNPPPPVQAQVLYYDQANPYSVLASASVSIPYGGTIHLNVHQSTGSTFGKIVIRTDGLPAFLDIQLAGYQPGAGGGLELVQKLPVRWPCAPRAFKDTLG